MHPPTMCKPPRKSIKPIEDASMEMIDMLFKMGEYAEALKGLRLLRKLHDDPEYHKIIDNLITCCKDKM